MTKIGAKYNFNSLKMLCFYIYILTKQQLFDYAKIFISVFQNLALFRQPMKDCYESC